jgi:hypothetical protein
VSEEGREEGKREGIFTIFHFLIGGARVSDWALFINRANAASVAPRVGNFSLLFLSEYYLMELICGVQATRLIG